MALYRLQGVTKITKKARFYSGLASSNVEGESTQANHPSRKG
jgi:hypothetical protein